MTIALDVESALDEASGYGPLNIDQASFKLLQDIRNRIKALSIDIKWHWVERYQNENDIRI